jgi:penicillin amidase
VVDGLLARAEVIIDRWGVPHVYAASRQDAFFAQGFMHARERLFQMDVSRRAGRATLSELFGTKTLEADRFLRRLGLHRAAAAELPAFDAETRAYFEAYTAGVNAGAQSRARPIEYRILRAAFEPWEVLDSVAFGRLMALNLSCNWDTELARADMVAGLGPKTAAAVEPLFSDLHPTVVEALESVRPALEDLHAEFERVASVILPSAGMSNGWAVAPTRTTSGRALLANDPHLAPAIPSTWYECEIEAPDMHVTGASLPGLPGVMIGHNDRIAWGITASMADVQDVAIYPAPALEAAERVREVIRVRGKADEVEEVFLTADGPILETQPDGRGVAIRTTILDPRPLAPGVLGVMLARDWDEFRTACAKQVAPALCYTYADVEGSIGFQLAGLIPRRKGSSGYLPWPGDDERFGWDGFVPFEDLPSTYNPAAGAIVNANNQLERGPVLKVPGEFVDGYRAKRIVQLLDATPRHSVHSFQQMQGDVYAIHADELFARIDGWQPHDPRLREALVDLRGWDRRLTAGGRHAAIFEAFFLHLMWNVLRTRLGDFASAFLGKPARGMSSAPPLCWRVASLTIGAMEPDSRWFDSMRDRDAVLNRSLSDALRDLDTRLGPDPSAWRWGDIHRLRYVHPLGRVPALAGIFNRGHMRLPGDMHTVWQTAYHTYDPYDVKAWTVSYRQVLDVGNWDNCWSMHSPGQSGLPWSRHYADFLRPWRRVEYHPMTFSRDALKPNARGSLRLRPR